ncbi:MAG: hypothetical protein H0T73_19315 [Ardenticatenales bacterium]|nr:hypothetical protein [Ardenticatenales bacterium]
MASSASTQPNSRIPLDRSFKILFNVVAVLTVITGFVLFFFPERAGGMPPGVSVAEARPLWPWPLTPLVSRYLGSLFLGVGVGAAAAARQTWWEQVRVMVIPGIVFTGMALLSSAIHFGSFQPSRIVTWLYFALYTLVFVAALVLSLRHEQASQHGEL